MRWHLFVVDDQIARQWSPVAVTQPAGEILFGALTLRERLERASGLAAAGYLAAPGLEGFTREGVPPLTDSGELPDDEALVLLSSRYVPPLGGEAGPGLNLPDATSDREARLVVDGAPVGWLLPPGTERPSMDVLTGLDGDARSSSARGQEVRGEPDAGHVELPGSVLHSLWELVQRNGDQLSMDLASLLPGGEGDGIGRLPFAPGVEQVGADPISAAQGVIVDTNVVLDTRAGPIHLESGVHIRPFTHLRGPALVGAGSTLLGGLFESVSCGPVCRLRGEVSSSILLGYTNKAHDGYLGHSLVGRWVNFGAMTTNSDLKNNYGTVRVGTSEGEVDTRLLKVGVFLGDHVKMGIGTMLNAGTTVGTGTNLLGGGLPPKWIPAYHWGAGPELVPYRLDAFLETAERAMARRGIQLSSGERSFLRRSWERVHDPDPGVSGV